MLSLNVGKMERRRVKILPSVTQQIGAGTGNNYLTSKPILLTVMPHQFSSSFLLKETSRDAAHGLSLLTSPVNVKTAVLKHCFIFLDYYNKLLQTKWFIITEMHFLFTVLEARGPKQRFWQGHAFSEGSRVLSFFASSWLALLDLSFPSLVHDPLLSVPLYGLFIKMPVNGFRAHSNPV